MQNEIYTIDELKDILHDIFVKYNLAKVSVFGSYARNEAKVGADVDILIKTTDVMDLPTYYDFVKELALKLNTHIDITFEDYINPYMKDTILSEAVLLYEK